MNIQSEMRTGAKYWTARATIERLLPDRPEAQPGTMKLIKDLRLSAAAEHFPTATDAEKVFNETLAEYRAAGYKVVV